MLHELSDPQLAPIRDAARQILAGHSPYPAALIDQHWDLIDANAAVGLFTAGAAPQLLEPPVNVLRLALHPNGMAPRIGNLSEWRGHLLDRLRRQVSVTGDPALTELYHELVDYPGGNQPTPSGHVPPAHLARPSIAVALRYRYREIELSFLSTTTVFGTPLDVTVAGLAIESFFPADAATAANLHAVLQG
jgi:MmyB-like transcription regulator ligand binding domain